MLRDLAFCALSALFATTALAAPATCTGAKYLDAATGTCKPCGSRTVKTCSSATVATSCVSRYYLTADGRCVANGQCPVSTFADHSSGKCDKCFLSTYKTCSNGKSYSATSCVAQHCLNAGRCMPFTQIKNTSHCNKNGTIAPCPGQGASTCAVDGTTLSCKPSYFLDSKTRTCTPCGEHVARCDETGALECNGGSHLSQGKCIAGLQLGEPAGITCTPNPNGPCSDGFPWDCYRRTCQVYCPAYATAVEGGIIPALHSGIFNDGSNCEACPGGPNVWYCSYNGVTQGCFNSYYSPHLTETLPNGQISGRCISKEECLAQPGGYPLEFQQFSDALKFQGMCWLLPPGA